MKKWGTEGRARYRDHFLYDAVHPLIFAALGVVSVSTSPVFERLSRNRSIVLGALLPVAAFFDYCENGMQWYLLGGDTVLKPGLVMLSAICAAVKWAFATVFVVAATWASWKWWWCRHVVTHLDGGDHLDL